MITSNRRYPTMGSPSPFQGLGDAELGRGNSYVDWSQFVRTSLILRDSITFPFVSVPQGELGYIDSKLSPTLFVSVRETVMTS